MGLGNIKYLLGDTSLKYDIYRTIKQTFDKTDNSDYATESNQSRRMLLNGERFPLKRYEFLTVTKLFDLKESLKLKTDSIFHHYYKTLFKNIEYSDTFNTLSILFSDMEAELNAMSESFETETFKPEITMKPLNAKSLMKWIELSLTIDELEINPYDLTYDDIIIAQLKIIYELSSMDQKKKWLVYLTLPTLTSKIQQHLAHNRPENVHYLVDAPPTKIESIDNVLWLGDPTIDFVDDVAVYEELTMKKGEFSSIEATKEHFQEIINTYGTFNSAKLRGKV